MVYYVYIWDKASEVFRRGSLFTSPGAMGIYLAERARFFDAPIKIVICDAVQIPKDSYKLNE